MLSDCAMLRSRDGLASTKAARGDVRRGLDRDGGLAEHPRGDPGRPCGKVVRLFGPLPRHRLQPQGRDDARVEAWVPILADARPARGTPDRTGRGWTIPCVPPTRTWGCSASSIRPACGPSPSRNGTWTDRRSRSWKPTTAMRSSGPWDSGWPRGSAHRSPARASSRRRSSLRSRSSCCRDTRRCRARSRRRRRSCPIPGSAGSIDYLHDSFGEEISLDGLAQVAGLSPNYFISAFKQLHGVARPTAT